MDREKQHRDQAQHQSLDQLLTKATRYFDSGQLPEAAEICKLITAVQPKNVDAILLLGKIACADKQVEWAKKFLYAALDINPAIADAHNELGNLFRQTGDLSRAESCFRQAISLAPDSCVPLGNLGAVLANSGNHKEAVDAFEKAAALEPKNIYLYSNYLLCLQYDDTASAERRYEAARNYGKKVSRARAYRGAAQSHSSHPNRPLRIGYVSPDLGLHPVGIFISGVLSAHDRDAFQVYCYSDRLMEDELTKRLKSWSHKWRPTRGVDDRTLMKQIRTDQIDILVDLCGHAGAHRHAVFTGKPAPIQVSWLGYPATTGLAEIDYVISDPITVPGGAEKWFSEEVVQIPAGRFCYTPSEYAPPVSPAPFLSNDRITFGSFNNLTKVTPRVIQVWTDILKALPEARLILKWRSLKEIPLRNQVRRLFKEAGIDPDQIELRAASPHRQMLEEYGDIDIALDPFPFSGGLTSCEALWQGVPIVTMAQERPSSRQTLAFLTALGLPELAATNRADYVRLAVDLANSPERLSALRSTIRPRMKSSTLCDGQGFTRNIETAYRGMWQRWCEQGMISQQDSRRAASR